MLSIASSSVSDAIELMLDSPMAPPHPGGHGDALGQPDDDHDVAARELGAQELRDDPMLCESHVDAVRGPPGGLSRVRTRPAELERNAPESLSSSVACCLVAAPEMNGSLDGIPIEFCTR